MKLSLVILTLNEIDGVRAILDRIPFAAVDECFAVDGGSTDGTIEYFKKKGIPCHIQTARGRGEAFRMAFQKSTADAIIFFSPDGNENPDDIPRFRPLLEAGNDLVIGTRMIRGAHNEEDEKLFKWRKWANQAFTLIANLTWNHGPYVTDTINGYRAITRKAWNELSPDGPGYTIEYQSTIRAFKRRIKISEFPTHESGRIFERTGSPSIPTGLAFVKLYLSELRKEWQKQTSVQG